jgi:hypothetical protein
MHPRSHVLIKALLCSDNKIAGFQILKFDLLVKLLIQNICMHILNYEQRLEFEDFRLYDPHVWMCIYTYTRPRSVQAQYSRSCPIISSTCYNGSLVTRTVVFLTTAKFMPLIFPASGLVQLSSAQTAKRTPLPTLPPLLHVYSPTIPLFLRGYSLQWTHAYWPVPSNRRLLFFKLFSHVKLQKYVPAIHLIHSNSES